MKTLLIFPPCSDPVHPPLGIAKLAGYLDRYDKEICLMDLNIESYHYFLNQESLTKRYNKVKNRLKELRGVNNLSSEEEREYSCLYKSYLDGEYLIDHIDQAMKDLRKEAVYADWELYGQATSVLIRSMKLVGDSFYPTKWDPRNLSFSLPLTDDKSLEQIVNNKEINPFMEFMEANLERILKENGGIIGISINYFCQLVPGLTLAKLIKKHCPDVPVLLGGSFFASYSKRWQVLKSFNKYADIIIPFEGEVPLLHVIKAVEKQESIESLQGVLYLHKDLLEYKECFNDEKVGDTLPSFKGFDLEQYLTPRRMLPYSFTRGCYWGRCAFCSQHLLYKSKGYASKKLDKVTEDIKELKKLYQVEDIYFVDEAIPVNHGLKLADFIERESLKIEWFGDMRLESSLHDATISKLIAGGCKMLIMGLESSQQRVIDLMEKGTCGETLDQILQACGRANLRTFVMFFIGFPTETRDEAMGTIKFVEHHKDHIHYISFDRFVLLKETPVHLNSEKYKIETKELENNELAIHLDYTPKAGLTKKEAAQLLKEIKGRKSIKSYTDRLLVSRSHLPYLPFIKTRSAKKELDSKVCPNLRPYTRIVQNKKESGDEKLVYSPYSEILLSVNEDALNIVEQLNGIRTINEIMKGYGEKVQGEVKLFISKLYEKGMI